ncbi:hypothetical protein KY346_02105 [Candidatus Woesearchaeota archaeon]|nr:hypothetical protein [Candidatus Woesearchaeota archaeon]
MKADKIHFIKKMILFCILLTISFALLNWIYCATILPKSSLEKTNTQFKNSLENIDIIFMGASHTKTAINPLIINKSFNFGANAENYILTYYKFRTILNSYTSNIQTVVLPLDLHVFSPYLTTRFENDWYWRKYIDFKELANFTNESIFKKEIKSIFPLLDSGSDLIELLMRRKTSKIVKGHILSLERFSNAQNRTQLAANTAKRHLEYSQIIKQDAFLYFKKIIELANRREVTVILIKYPVTKEYFIASKKYIADTEEFYKKIVNKIYKYNNVYILDYQKLFFDKNDLFKDDNHLNKWGAEILSKQVAKDLEKIKLNIMLNNQISDFINQK